MNITEHSVDLDKTPAERWSFLAQYRDEIDELLSCYLSDLSGAETVIGNIGSYKSAIISQEYLEEIEYISSISKYSPDEVLIANLYYDALKFYFGCTAFAFDSGNGVLHARNLDWHTENNLLSKHTRIFDFQRNGQTIFKTVGWVGFIGALSGTRPGCFSITLNAVLSSDKAEIATPISFFIRDVLNNSQSFAEAKERLESTTIASDCLLLLSGKNSEELCVIERTPTRFATRGPKNGHVIVTNDYQLLDNALAGNSILQSTSCGRHDRANELLKLRKPNNELECFNILQDDSVMMGITVQQMVFNNHTGKIEVIKTGNQT